MITGHSSRKPRRCRTQAKALHQAAVDNLGSEHEEWGARRDAAIREADSARHNATQADKQADELYGQSNYHAEQAGEHGRAPARRLSTRARSRRSTTSSSPGRGCVTLKRSRTAQTTHVSRARVGAEGRRAREDRAHDRQRARPAHVHRSEAEGARRPARRQGPPARRSRAEAGRRRERAGRR